MKLVIYIHYIHFFWYLQPLRFFTLHAKQFEIWKNILWNWWVDCFIAWSIKSCDILDAHSESIFRFMQYFFSFQCFLRSTCHLLIAESVSWDNSGKPIVGFFLNISSSSWIILPISLNELNSGDWLLKRMMNFLEIIFILLS